MGIEQAKSWKSIHHHGNCNSSCSFTILGSSESPSNTLSHEDMTLIALFSTLLDPPVGSTLAADCCVCLLINM